jgi:tRNA modification GTPase
MIFLFNNDTICAPASAQGAGALAIIRISGKQAISIVQQVFSTKKIENAASHSVHYGYILNGNVPIDEVMVSIFRAPKTFTKEDLVEITCHGSHYIQQEIISLLIHNGARLAQAGEFSQRAFLNGRIDLSQAEAIADLIAAENKASHQIALNQLRGGVSHELQILREELVNFTALIELELDFSEEDVEFANRNDLLALVHKIKTQLQSLIKSFEYGNAIKNGVPVAIIGKPNAGKSTLLNALVNEERAIVSEIAGTTRDTIEEQVHIEGIAFRFIDTAGIRATSDTVEAIGVEKAIEKIKQAKIVIHLFDDQPDLLNELMPYLNNKIVFNLKSKSDLDSSNKQYEMDTSQFDAYSFFEISVKNQHNLDRLKSTLYKAVQQGFDTNAVIINNIRHKEALVNAFHALVRVEEGLNSQLTGDLLSVHLRDSLKHIGSVSGQIDFDKDILGTIFGKFCIGK